MTTSRSFSERALLGVITGFSLLLGACSAAQSSVTDLVDGAMHTASGTISTAKSKAQEAIKPVTDAIDDAQQRIDAVGSGVLKVKQGIDQLKGAVKR